MEEVIIIYGFIHQVKGVLDKGIKIHNIVSGEKVPESLEREGITNYTSKDYSSVEDLVSILMKKHNITAIISFIDGNDGVQLANFLSNKYQLVSDNNSVVSYFTDKSMARELLLDKKIRSVSYLKSDKPYAILEFLDQHKKIVLKPIDGQGSSFVSVLELSTTSIEDIEELFKYSGSEHMIAEKFIVGKEYSVETISFNGEHKIIGITEKVLSEKEDCYFVEKGHIFPAPINLDEQKRISDYVKSFLNASNLQNGVTHTEVFMNKGGPVLVESQLRAGGDLIPRLIEKTLGIDIYALGIEVLMGKGDLFRELKENENKRLFAGINYFFPETGYIEKAPEAFDFKNLKIDRFVYKFKDGTVINPITKTSNRKYGYITATDRDAAYLKMKLKEISDEVVNKIKFRGNN
jgi:predicted ATP-grasp superfamily ATP-dependent carboligase